MKTINKTLKGTVKNPSDPSEVIPYSAPMSYDIPASLSEAGTELGEKFALECIAYSIDLRERAKQRPSIEQGIMAEHGWAKEETFEKKVARSIKKATPEQLEQIKAILGN